MGNRVRLIDIANKAGVSKMTVSLALRNDPSISRETTNMIKEIADTLGYVPNRIAKGLVNGRTYTIAAIVGGDMHDDYHNQFLKGATDYAMGKGYTLTIALTEGDKKLETEIIRKYQEMGIDGYLVFHCGSSTNYKKMKEQGIPFVLYTKYFEDMDCDYVTCDDLKGGYDMTRYFLEQGHERIAYIYDKGLKNSSEVKNRCRGYQKAMEETSQGFEEIMVIPYDNSLDGRTVEEKNPELMELLHSDKVPTAFFICNDVVAAAFLADMKSLGCRIPEDFSIAGYEGVYLGAVLDPPLTTMSTPIRDMGKTACELLIKEIEGKIQKNQISRISMEPVLTIRKSVKRREELE